MEDIVVQNISKKFGDYKAVDNLSFAVPNGKIFGLLGPNGAGKTTTIRMITNILFPDTGTIEIMGKKVSGESQNYIGYLPEERGLYKKLKVIDQLAYFAQLKGVSAQLAKSRASEWLKRLGAAGWELKKIQELSKGMQQKVQFISTILHEPPIMILDEPFSGFDPINTELLKNVIMEMKSAGKTIILSTHVMAQVEQMCDEMVLINKGKIVLAGEVQKVKSSFGENTILLEYEGDPGFPDELRNIQILDRTIGRLSFKFDNPNDDLNAFLASILGKVKVYKFEKVAPSLHEIFIDVVGKANIQEKESANVK